MAIEALQGLLAELGVKIGLPELRADDEGYCALSFDDQQVHLQYEPDTDELLVFARLGAIGEEERGPLLERLLEANLFWGGTGGATLGLQPEDGMVFLAQRKALAALDSPRLEALLNSFVSAAERWHNEVAQYVSTGADLTGEVDAPEGIAAMPAIYG